MTAVKVKTVDFVLIQTMAYLFIGLIAFAALLPFLLLVIGSFSSEHDIIANGFTLWPQQLSLNAYRSVFRFPQKIMNAYGITIYLTTVGTLVSLFLSSMAAYVLYRRELKYRNALAFFLFFTTLFNGGLAPYYILVTRYLHLKDTATILMLAPMFSVFHILILRSFIKSSIPDALVESAKMDGAGSFRIFIQVILPLLKPALASIGLFTALGYWNDWWTPMMFIQKDRLFPLQFTLYQMLSSINLSVAMGANVAVRDTPQETFKLAMTVVATGPIILLYPFLQKYFVKGITIGAVKG